MPRYRVVEKRAYRNTYIIDAENELDAETGEGAIVSEWSEDSLGDSLESCEQIGDDEEE